MTINFHLHFQNLLVSLNLLAKTALELSQCLYLISYSDSNRFNTLQGKPNHTTCGHSRSPTWQPFTSRRPGFPTCNTYSERSIPLVSRAPARVVPDAPAGRLNSIEGYSSYVSPGAYELRRFTEPHNTACD